MSMLTYREDEYSPDQPKGRAVKLDFDYINPNSTGTIEKQQKILHMPGYTVVTFLEKEDVIKFLEPLSQLARITSLKFVPSPNLHLTILGLDGRNSFIHWYEDDIKE
jgi:hypothetical protein